MQVESPINKSRGHQNRNLSQAPVKGKGPFTYEQNVNENEKSDSFSNNKTDTFNKSSKQPKLKIGSKKLSNSPIKLDNNLKSIENRILAKMKNKRDNNNPLMKMPSIERNHSPTIPYSNDFDSSKLTLSKINDYNVKSTSKKNKHRNAGIQEDLSKVRETLASAFPINDSDSFANKINYVKPNRDSQSEYDLYNSYGSSIGFISDEKRMSDKMKNKIKQSFRYRDEIETAETDSFFSSKFSKFSPQNGMNGQTIARPNKSIMNEIIKRQQSENSMPLNFPSIKKNIPNKSAPFSLPSLK